MNEPEEEGTEAAEDVDDEGAVEDSPLPVDDDKVVVDGSAEYENEPEEASATGAPLVTVVDNELGAPKAVSTVEKVKVVD